ncbi:hypothetical protein HDV05_005697 [Chytridiales sp. JEL 0842]|nr:hypothetical protein HDV05_005697 [Chytridiales sp. JEL 0842]
MSVEEDHQLHSDDNLLISEFMVATEEEQTLTDFESMVNSKINPNQRKKLKDMLPVTNTAVCADNKPRLTMKATNPWSFFSLSYLNDMMKTSVKRPLEVEDIPMLKEEDRADALAKCLEPFTAQVASRLRAEKDQQDSSSQKLPPKVSVLRPIFKTYGHLFSLALFFQLLQVASALYIPFVLQALIRHLQNRSLANSGQQMLPNIPAVPFQDNGVALSIFLFVVSVLSALCEPTMSQFHRNFQFNIGGIVRTAVFEKALRISNTASKEFDEGMILSLMNVDADQLAQTFTSISNLLSLPIEIIFTIVFLIRLIGIAIYPSIIIIICTFAITTPVAAKFGTFRREYMVTQDRRIKKIREVLLGIRVVKLGATEEIREMEIDTERNAQVKALLSGFNYLCVLLAAADLPASLMPMASFLVFSQMNGGMMDPAVIFPAMIYFGNLYQPMQQLPNALSGIVTGRVALLRIDKFLYASERDVDFGFSTSSNEAETEGHESKAIEIKDLTAKWQAPPAPKEESDSKSKIQKLFSKRTAKPNGASASNPERTFADTSKQLFQNLSLHFPTGKLTAIVGAVGAGKSSLLSAIIGEMTTLSGTVSVRGRVALCQQQPWLLSLTVEQNILFGRELDSAKLQLALQSTSFTRDLSMMDGGLKTEIGEKGIALSGGQKARLALARAVYDDADVYLLDDPLAALDAQVGREIFENCIQNALHGKTRVLVTHQMQVLNKVDRVIVMQDGKIAEEGTYEELMGMEGGILRGMMKDYKTNDSTTKIKSGSGKDLKIENESDKAADSMKQTKIESKDKSGKGNLIVAEERQRGALKLSVLVEYFKLGGGVLAVSLLITGFLLQSLIGLTWIITLIGFYAAKNLHKSAIAGLLCAPMSFFDSQPIGRILNRLSKDIQGVDQTIHLASVNFYFALSIIVSSLASLAYATPYVLIVFGILMVFYYFFLILYRAASRELKRINSIERSPLNAHISESLGGLATLRAFKAEKRVVQQLRGYLDRSNVPVFASMSIRLWLTIRISIFSAAIVLFVSLFGVLSTAFPASLMGLAISTCTDLTSTLWVFIMFAAMYESELVAAERLIEYSTNLPKEAAREMKTDPPSTEWPSIGGMAIKNLQVKYASMDEPVIRGMNLIINPGEKVGLVGRTGSDAAVWDALSMAGLKEYVSLKEGKLDSPVEENGSNLSVGQRQLLVLARALCARPKILVMDEASSAIDTQADALLQSSIRQHFAGSTVLSIAHRLNTIADFDKVVVMDAGRVVECDSPAKLLRIEGGVFRSLVDATGPANATLIQEIAEERETKRKAKVL